MQPPDQQPELFIANEYVEKISRFLEDRKEWFTEAQKWNEGNYGKIIISSINAARELLQSKIEFETGVEEFAKSVTDVYEITANIDKNSLMTSKIISIAGSNNDEINSIASQTLDQLRKISPSQNNTEQEAPVSEESSFDVRKIQEALQKLGFPVRIADGIWGPQTSSAIQDFQLKKSLEATGNIDQETYTKLMEDAGFEKPQPIKKVTNLFLPLLASEGNHQDTEDKLDFEYDIQSLATVIALKNVNPPLAIGLFGNWGSGKSFFMEKLNKEIQLKAESKSEEFVENVVHVKFNSWHYSDSNLWASMITEIFDSLNAFATKEHKEDELKKLSDSLNITTAQREVVEARRIELQEKIEMLSKEKERQRSRLEDISGINIFKLLLSDKNFTSDLKILKNENVEVLIQSEEKLDSYLNELTDWKKKFMYFFRTLREMKGKRWAGVLIVSLIVLATAISINYFFREQWASLTQWLAGIATVIVVNAGNVIRLIRPVAREFNLAIKRLSSLKETFDSRPQQGLLELDQMKKEVESITQSLAEIDKTISDTRNEIEDLRTGRKLLEFIQQRSRDEKYSQQLGLISWIRKDFSKLDELLHKQHQLTEEEKEKQIVNPYDVQLRIDRIILYIDDLDRCNEEIVVKVLEAIHLLLAFPLFVVVVGVDPRWLNNALSEKYKNLFGKHYSDGIKEKKTTKEEIDQSAVATSYDYLEKIFQIPFSLRQINSKGRKDLIQYLLRKEMEETPKPPPDSENGKVGPGKITPVIGSKTLPGKVKTPVIPPIPETIEEQKKRLTFIEDELECMQSISAVFGHSPRTINRFVNIYRIIKAHRKRIVTGDFSEDDYAPIMLVLSVMVGYSELAVDFISKLSKEDDTILFNEFLKTGKFPDTFVNKILESIKPSVAGLPVKAFKNNLELISRFSFRTFAVSLD
jgi:hypothetical protein